jgi:CheY-like chemotaxis protein
MIVCDVDLPGMGGIAFQAALAKKEQLRDISFVFMASSALPEIVRYVRDVARTRLIMKSDLIRSLSELLAQQDPTTTSR